MEGGGACLQHQSERDRRPGDPGRHSRRFEIVAGGSGRDDQQVQSPLLGQARHFDQPAGSAVGVRGQVQPEPQRVPVVHSAW